MSAHHTLCYILNLTSVRGFSLLSNIIFTTKAIYPGTPMPKFWKKFSQIFRSTMSYGIFESMSSKEKSFFVATNPKYILHNRPAIALTENDFESILLIELEIFKMISNWNKIDILWFEIDHYNFFIFMIWDWWRRNNLDRLKVWLVFSTHVCLTLVFWLIRDVSDFIFQNFLLICLCISGIIHANKKMLRDGESNPGLPRDRRGYSPLYYRGTE